MNLFVPLFLLTMLQQLSFKEKQLQYARVKDAYQTKEITVKNYFINKNLNYQGYHLFLRAFKKEKELEVWIKPQGQSQYELLLRYDFCSVSGELGPKRKEGDKQIPEGIYSINHFNPQSNFHLSLGINYPNRSDQLLGDRNPGSAIYIHGDCVTIGCIPITDDKIKELYVIAVEARNNGQQNIPVHIFPSRLTTDTMSELEETYAQKPELVKFWKNLQRIYKDFEEKRQLKSTRINDEGEYYF
jgi:murein L,D-transpeptidase YafK